MKNYQEILLQKIEIKRQKMVEAAMFKGLTHEETILHSQELDRLINLHQLQKDNKKGKSISKGTVTNEYVIV